MYTYDSDINPKEYDYQDLSFTTSNDQPNYDLSDNTRVVHTLQQPQPNGEYAIQVELEIQSCAYPIPGPATLNIKESEGGKAKYRALSPRMSGNKTYNFEENDYANPKSVTACK